MAAKLLVVDDKPIVKRMLVAAALVHLEAEQVIEAENGRQALDILEGQDIGLVITDIEMPKISGLEVIKAAKEKGIAVIALSGKPLKYAEEAVRAGANAFLEKPLTGEVLTAVIGIIEKFNC